MNLNSNYDQGGLPHATKGILTKIFKNQHNRGGTYQGQQHQNYFDQLN